MGARISGVRPLKAYLVNIAFFFVKPFKKEHGLK